MRMALGSSWQIGSRVLAAVLGSYLFTWGFIALGSACLLRAGVEFHEATYLTSMLGFLVFLAAFCFAFIAARLRNVWGLLAIGGGAMTLAGWWLSRSLG